VPVTARPSTTDPARVAVREARPADFEAIGTLAVAAYRALGGEPEAYLAEIHDTTARAVGATVLVALDRSGVVLGTATYERHARTPVPGQVTADAASMRVLAVTPQAQGQGVGRALVEAVIARARADGRNALAIYTRPSMVAAHRLYASLGFERDSMADWQFEPGEWLLGYRLGF
jgi:GNAT superfamily N-acetyltransferase